MTVAPHLLGIRISNFRSIVEPLEVPLKSKMTFLVGQNNSGKSGVLRFLALLLNNGEIIDEDKSTLASKPTKAEYIISSDAVQKIQTRQGHLLRAILPNPSPHFTVEHKFEPNPAQKLSDNILQVVNSNYFSGSGQYSERFHEDFHQSSSDVNRNIQHFLSVIWQQLKLPKTVYVPSHRVILIGDSLQHYGQIAFPGNRIQLEKIVEALAVLQNPFGNPNQRNEAKLKLSAICTFMAYCLEVKDVQIQIPDGKQTIYVSVNGNEQPISHLGSGIEQLIIIGMGSFVFSDHIVLIDEPEIHFHPRTQKRMMKYLYDHADAKFVIATHSAAILDSVEADIVQVWQENHQCFGRTVQNNSDRHEAVKNLGHSPSELVLANFVIWVEGPSDRIYFNHWIQKLDPSLVEGTDYAIIFYGGSVLARHGFEDGDDDLVKALSISRNFAVYMDSDKSAETDGLKSRVERVAQEVVTNGGLSWISIGREIENYVPHLVLEQVAGCKVNSHEKFAKIVEGDFDKVKFAERVTKLWGDEWPLDLKEKCASLVAAIQRAR